MRPAGKCPALFIGQQRQVRLLQEGDAIAGQHASDEFGDDGLGGAEQFGRLPRIAAERFAHDADDGAAEPFVELLRLQRLEVRAAVTTIG